MFPWLLALALTVSAPAPVAVAYPAPVPAPPEQVMAIPPALQARLHDEVLADQPSQSQRLERLAHFMFDPQTAWA